MTSGLIYLYESIEINYAIDEFRGKRSENDCVASRQTTDSRRREERIFAEAVAKTLGLAYFPESCIAGSNEQLELLKKARDIISKRMDVGPIKDEKYHEVYKKKFVFYS